MYLINPGKRKKKIRNRKGRFVKQNPMKTRRRRRRPSFTRKNPVRRRRRRGFARRNPARRRRRSTSIRHALIFPNAGKRRRRRRRGFASRNPMRRRRSFTRRNPASGIGSTIFDRDTMVIAGGVIVGSVGTNMLLNAILLPNTAGNIPFKLPGVNVAGVNYMNSVPVALYKFGIGAGIGYLLRNTAPRLAQGIVVGAFAGAISSVLQSTNVLAGLPGGSSIGNTLNPQAGVSRYFRPSSRRGSGSYTPGVNPIFTGPASGFLRGGSPMRMGMRRGAGAMFNRSTVRNAKAMIPNPFG
jgi:hypothetical protein